MSCHRTVWSGLCSFREYHCESERKCCTRGTVPQTAGVTPVMEFTRRLKLWHSAHKMANDMVVSFLIDSFLCILVVYELLIILERALSMFELCVCVRVPSVFHSSGGNQLRCAHSLRPSQLLRGLANSNFGSLRSPSALCAPGLLERFWGHGSTMEWSMILRPPLFCDVGVLPVVPVAPALICFSLLKIVRNPRVFCAARRSPSRPAEQDNTRWIRAVHDHV